MKCSVQYIMNVSIYSCRSISDLVKLMSMVRCTFFVTNGLAVNFLFNLSLTSTMWSKSELINEKGIQRKFALSVCHQRVINAGRIFLLIWAFLFLSFIVPQSSSLNEIAAVYRYVNSIYKSTWCSPTRWQRFLSTESEMLRRRILVEERGRFPLFLLENGRKIDKGSSWISFDFWSSSKSRRRTVVLRSIFTLGQNKFHYVDSDSVISAKGRLITSRFVSRPVESI